MYTTKLRGVWFHESSCGHSVRDTRRKCAGGWGQINLAENRLDRLTWRASSSFWKRLLGGNRRVDVSILSGTRRGREQAVHAWYKNVIERSLYFLLFFPLLLFRELIFVRRYTKPERGEISPAARDHPISRVITLMVKQRHLIHINGKLVLVLI